MLALPPFDLMEEELVTSKEELCDKLIGLVLAVLVSGDLQRLEISWNRGATSIRMLKKEVEDVVSVEVRSTDSSDTIPAPTPVDALEMSGSTP